MVITLLDLKTIFKKKKFYFIAINFMSGYWKYISNLNNISEQHLKKSSLFKLFHWKNMTILKGVPTILSPHLLQVLAEMGHGDYIVLADANFPSSSVGSHCKAGVIRMDGHDIPKILKAILTLLPLDTYVKYPVFII